MRSFRPTLLASVLLACGLGCSPRVSTGALKVEVVYDANVVSKCVKVVASDDVGSPPLETMPIPLANQSSPLLVGVGGSSPLAQPFRVQALGYSDEGCTVRSNEESTAEPGVFAVPPKTVTLVLKAQPQNDGGADAGSTDGGEDAGSTDAGAPDAGADAGVVDAGLDRDMDGYPESRDCNDNNPQIHPDIPEVCNNNNVDDNCNGRADCAEDSCDAGTCTNMGTCTNGQCMTAIEVCNDNFDNNNNSLVDCAEPSCAMQACNDSSDCTVNETCSGADGGCAGTLANLCMSPPVCHAMAGVCQADGGMCSYTPLNSGPCDDQNACTMGDTCSSGMCTGTSTPCPNNTTNVCLGMAGTCERASGMCKYTPLVTGPCSDNNNCTLNDTCDGDGGCRSGTPADCTEPSPCHRWDNTCQGNGDCNFVPRATCDAGMGAPGSCNAGFQCVPVPANVFPYTPSTFTEAQLPTAAASGFTVSCNTVINTGGTTPAVVDGGCVTLPAFAILPATDGGQETLLLKVSSLTVNSNQTLIFTGPRPVVLAVLGNATVDGTILGNSGQAPASLCGVGGTGSARGGAGGGGFGTSGAPGGTGSSGSPGDGGTANGTVSLDPIRGGCAGGASASANGGAGGGAIQLSAAGDVNIAGVIATPGQGGAGGTSTDSGGGGGGSGGAILIEGSSVTTTSSAKLTANGGGGGGGEEDGNNNGGPGNPGNPNSTNVASGGSGPGGAGNGGAGGAGATAPATGEAGGMDGAGGGGGAVGRIRLRVRSGGACSVDTSTVFSPLRGTAGGGC